MTVIEENIDQSTNVTFHNIFNLEKLLEHKIFIIFILIAISGVAFIVWRSFKRGPSSTVEEDNEKGTQEMMDELGVNLSKNALEEHLTSSESDKQESEDENSIGGDNDDHIDTLSNDLNNLEVYTQNSTDL